MSLENISYIDRAVNHVPSMLAYWDVFEICRYANKSYLDWFGMSPEEMINNISLRQLLGPLYEQNRANILGALSGKPQVFERELRTPAGEIRYSLATYTPDVLEGKVIGFTAHVTDISSVKLLENEIKLSELKFRDLVEHAPDPIIMVNDVGIIQIANLQFEAVFGYKRAEVYGKPIEILMPERYKKNHIAHRMLFFNSPSPRPMGTDLKLFGLHKSGREFPIEISISPLKLPNGTFVSAAIRDISARVKAEEQLREISNRLQLATLNSKIGIWEFDIANNVLLWDEIMMELYGIQKADFKGAYETWTKGVHPDDVKERERLLQSAIKGEEEFDTAFRVVWPSGSIHHIKAKALVLRDEVGNAVRMIGTNWDISAQKRAEIQIFESAKQNRIFVEQLPGAIAMFDRNMNYMAASRQWFVDYNIEGIDVIGKSHYEVFPEIGADWKRIHQECLNGAINKCREAPFPRTDGSLQWLSWDVRPWFDAEGDIGGILMQTDDITLVKSKEEDNRRLEKILEKASEIARMGTWEVDLISNKITWSKTTKEIHEVPDNYVPDLTRAINFFNEGESRKTIEGAVGQAIETGNSYDHELQITSAKGQELWVRTIGLAESLNGQVTKLYGVFQDITSKKNQEIMLQGLNSKLEKQNFQLANFAQITSHNLRSPVGNLTVLLDIYKKPADEEQKEMAFLGFEKVINHLSETLNTLVEALKISDAKNEEMIMVSFDQVLKKVIEMISGLIQISNTEIRTDFSLAPEIKYHPQYIESILLNLLTNSIKYKHPNRAPEIEITTRVVDGIIELRVRDNGLGIDLVRHGKKLFGLNKVFHRHPEAKGVGLYLTKSQVEAMGGTISAESEVNIGTTFTIIF